MSSMRPNEPSGRLKTQLDYAEPDEIAKPGVPQYCERISADVAEAAHGACRQRIFFTESGC